MKERLHRWEIALMVGVVWALIWGIQTDREQRELADSLIRLHVIANSDRPEDQAVKLRVRDAVLEVVAQHSADMACVDEMEELLTGLLPELEETGRRVLEEAGFSYPVRAGLERCSFPTKQYDGFALPAGEYKALRLELGAAQGQNWWCVAFPPLCLGAAGEELDLARQAGIFTKEQTALMTQTGRQYVLRFRSMELLGQLKQWWREEIP